MPHPSSLRCLCAVRLLTSFCLLAIAPAMASAQLSKELYDVVDGWVGDIEVSGETLYVGGLFSALGLPAPLGAVLDDVTGDEVPGFPRMAGSEVDAAVSDGADGWFVGGLFTTVGGMPRTNLARVRADLTVDGWSPAPNNHVRALAVSGGTLYVGGSFTQIAGTTRNRLAAFDIATGALLPWNPNANSDVHVITISGGVLYVGGAFQSVGGDIRSRIAALHPVSGLATPWHPGGAGVNNTVHAIAVGGGNVYAGGVFTIAATMTRNRAAAFREATGAITAWDPNVAGGSPTSIRALAYGDSVVYAGGLYTIIGGALRNCIAALDTATGMATPWYPQSGPNQTVHCIVPARSRIYIGGAFTGINGQARGFAAGLDPVTGLPDAWNPRMDQQVLTLAPSGSRIYAGGMFRTINTVERRNLAAIDLTTGRPTSWNPSPDQRVQTIAVGGSNVYLAGFFDNVGGRNQRWLAAVDRVTGLATGWSPNVCCGETIREMAIAPNGDLILAGYFSAIGGQPRNHIAPINVVTGQSAWDSYANNAGETVLPIDSTIYVGGHFTGIGGLPIYKYIAELHAGYGGPTSWNPVANGPVYALERGNGTIYAGGAFSTMGPQQRSRVAEISRSTGQVTAWNPNANNQVWALKKLGNRVYLGGTFTTVGGVTRSRLAVVDDVNGALLSWNPVVNGEVVLGLAHHQTDIIIAGDLSSVGGEVRYGLAAFRDPALVDVAPAPRPSALRLLPPRPHPLHDAAELTFELPRPERVSLAIYDVAGRRVRSLLDDTERAAGRHRERIARGSLGPGLYLVRLKAGRHEATTRLVVL